MPYEVYKVIHITGIMLLFVSLGGPLYAAWNHAPLDKSKKRPWAIMHGVSLFFVLLGGFGLLARLGIGGSFPGWIWGKLAIWGLMGALLTAIAKMPHMAKIWLSLSLLLGAMAAVFANYKPF